MKPINRSRFLFVLYDLTLVTACTLFIAWIHDDFSFSARNEFYHGAFIIFPPLWVLISLVSRKFRIGEESNQKEVFFSILISNFIILAIIAIVMVLTGLTFFSRFIVFGSFTLITVMELITGFIYVSIHQSVFLKDWIGMEISEKEALTFAPALPHEIYLFPREFESLRDSITEEAGSEAFQWIHSQTDITDPKNLIISTTTRFNILNYPAGYFKTIVNLEKINNIRRINKFFEAVNAKLPLQGCFIGCVETYALRKRRILNDYPPVLNSLVYAVDIMVHRVFPKLTLTRKSYFFFTRGKRRMLSRTEAIGRIYSCGFELLEEQTINGLLFWKATKISAPLMSDNASYGIFIRLRRIGRHGKEFNVYKLRTMHAYAEYIQKYVYEKHQLGEGGKFKDDFRVSSLGKILRKLWLDEIPMLLNVLKGDLKIVGVRPLSKHYFSLYTKELQEKRIRFKPGLIPPYYAQFPTPVTLEDVQRNEMEYLDAYEKHPLLTDVKYCFRAAYNILWKRARSK